MSECVVVCVVEPMCYPGPNLQDPIYAIRVVVNWSAILTNVYDVAHRQFRRLPTLHVVRCVETRAMNGYAKYGWAEERAREDQVTSSTTKVLLVPLVVCGPIPISSHAKEQHRFQALCEGKIGWPTWLGVGSRGLRPGKETEREMALKRDGLREREREREREIRRRA